MADPAPDLSPPPDDSLSSPRLPPQSTVAEQAVLGSLLLDNSGWDRITDTVTEGDFYRQSHRLIYQSVQSLIESGQPADVISVSEHLKTNAKLQTVGGLPYLGDLAENTPSVTNINAYAGIVREQSVLRALIRIGNAIASSGFRPEGRDALSLVEEAERQVFDLGERRSRGEHDLIAIRDSLTDVMERIERLYQSSSPITGIPTGFTDLDLKTAGLQPGDLIIIAGRPSMGKTALAMNLVESAAIASQLSVAVFSMEMPTQQLIMRMLSSLGRIDQHKVRTGKLEDADWPRLTSQLQLLLTTKIYIDDAPALTPTNIRSRCRRMKREHGLDLIVIDYIQLMRVSGSSENRATELSEISRNLKALAKELNVPVVALSQLNRALEQRPDKRPQMSDLRESGAIEQDADVILFVYRDEVYNEDSANKGKAEIIIGKQRNGPIGKVELAFLNHLTRFENFAHDDWTGTFSG